MPLFIAISWEKWQKSKWRKKSSKNGTERLRFDEKIREKLKIAKKNENWEKSKIGKNMKIEKKKHENREI